jgi:hypothetical protein
MLQVMSLQTMLHECENARESLEAQVASLRAGLETSQTERKALEKEKIELEISKSSLKQQLVGGPPRILFLRKSIFTSQIVRS